MKTLSTIRLCFLVLVLVAFASNASFAAPVGNASQKEYVFDPMGSYNAVQEYIKNNPGYAAELSKKAEDAITEANTKAAKQEEEYQNSDKGKYENQVKKELEAMNAAKEEAKKNGDGDNMASGAQVFDVITLKAVTTLEDLRYLAYIIAGFGIIVFAYGAVFGKISWKHLSNIGIGLFLIAMMAPVIEYFTQDSPGDGSKLKFGNHLKVNFDDYSNTNWRPTGSNDLFEKECMTGKTKSSGCMTPEQEAVINTKLSTSADMSDFLKKAGLESVSESKLGSALTESSSALKELVAGLSNKEGAEGAKNKKSIKELIDEGLGRVESLGVWINNVDGLAQGAMGLYGGLKQGGKELNKAAKTIATGGSATDVVRGIVNGANAYNNMSEKMTYGIYTAVNDVAKVSNATQDTLSDNETRAKNQSDRLYGNQDTNAVASAANAWKENNLDGLQNARNSAWDTKEKANVLDKFMNRVNKKIGKI